VSLPGGIIAAPEREGSDDAARKGRLTMNKTSFTKPISAPAREDAPILDAERLDCYVVALELQVAAAALASAVIRSFATSCGAPAFPSS